MSRFGHGEQVFVDFGSVKTRRALGDFCTDTVGLF